MEIHGVPNDLQMADVPYLCHFAEGIVTPQKKKVKYDSKKVEQETKFYLFGLLLYNMI